MCFYQLDVLYLNHYFKSGFLMVCNNQASISKHFNFEISMPGNVIVITFQILVLYRWIDFN